MKPLRITAVAGVLAVVAFALTATTAGAVAPSHDLSGTWKIDRAKSDSPDPPRGMMGGGDVGEHGMRGGGGGRGGMRGGAGAGGGMRGGMRGGGSGGQSAEGAPPSDAGSRPAGDNGMRRPGLPPYMTITETADMVAIADSAGTTVQEISLKPEAMDTPVIAKGAPRVPGTWKGDKLTVTRTNSRGVQMTETYSLANKGQTLVVQTKMQPGSGQGFEFKRVYQRAG